MKFTFGDENVHILVRKFAGQHMASPCIGESIILKWELI
jgi:hypothetical protein